MTQILPQLWLGGIDLTYDFEFLKENSITHIVTVLESQHGTHAMAALHIKQMSLRISDVEDAPIYDTFLPACQFIDTAIKGGGNVLVHCLMGISRSPTIVAAYLIWAQNMGVDDALKILKGLRPIVDPNDGFLKSLRQLKLFS
jgi:dual specificity phosphatase 12